MLCLPPGEVFDLLAAGNSWRDDLDFGSGCIYGRH